MATATEITTTTDILPLITATTTAITATDAVEGAQQHDSGMEIGVHAKIASMSNCADRHGSNYST